MSSIKSDFMPARWVDGAAEALREHAIAARPILRQAAPHARTQRTSPLAAIRDRMRGAIRDFASRGSETAFDPRDAEVRGELGQAINAGIHEVEPGDPSVR